MERARQCDLAIVGGGLAGGLIALAVHQARPDARVLLIEGGEALGGNHVWSFFEDDVAPSDRPLVDSLIAHRWPDYDVSFPARRRTLPSAYHSITSERFDAALRSALPAERLLTGRRAIGVSPRAVVLADGTRIEAAGVIDARGPGDLSLLTLGWQKFVGRELVLEAPHGLDRPVVMDATVEQIDGYRFVYLLPFAPNRVFVEDTYYSDTPHIDHRALAARIDRYARERGWTVRHVAREEAGALPVLLDGDFEAYWRSGGAHVAKAGARAALFHPTTGYSLPDAVRTAAIVGRMRDWRAPALHDALHAHARSAWRKRGFYRLLDRMLFRAAAPTERYRILERFYGLDERLVARFYAGHSTAVDKARILAGRPPVPIGRAIRALAGVG
ncbi:lycopene beta-cyclase CrtY [Sphingomonas sp.]|uniref:lycopene beta-cyclase CrtY n=1 Tax=Sphingomonas sp. TaxID=28214 RepID=UPI003B00D4BE